MRPSASTRSASTAGRRPTFAWAAPPSTPATSGVSARERGRHRVRAGSDPELRRDPEGGAPRRRARDDARGHPRPPEHPREQHRLLCPGREVPHGRLRPHERRHREGGRGQAHRNLRSALRGRAEPPPSWSPRTSAGRTRSTAWGASRRWARWPLGTETIDPVGHARRPRQHVCRGSQAPALRPGRHRPSSRGPTETLVIADETVDGELCAADLRTRHGADSCPRRLPTRPQGRASGHWPPPGLRGCGRSPGCGGCRGCPRDRRTRTSAPRS